MKFNGQVNLLRCDSNISVTLKQIRKVIGLILTVTYMMMLRFKFIALIAVTWKVLFAFIKSHCREKHQEREREKEERERFASLVKSNCQTTYKMLSKECTEWKTHVIYYFWHLLRMKGSFCNPIISWGFLTCLHRIYQSLYYDEDDIQLAFYDLIMILDFPGIDFIIVLAIA